MNKLLEMFGREGLRRWSASSLEDARIPAAAKEFLETTGLPAAVDGSLVFEAGTVALPRAPVQGLRRIGRYGADAQVCLDEAHEGRVVALEASGKLRLVNSSVAHLADCLGWFQFYRMRVRGLEDDDALALIDHVEGRIRAVDASALEYGDAWWPAVIAQMREGRL